MSDSSHTGVIVMLVIEATILYITYHFMQVKVLPWIGAIPDMLTLYIHFIYSR